MANMDNAWDLLRNGSLFNATAEAYQFAWDVWFFPLIFLFTLFLIMIKSESPCMVVIAAIIGNVALFGLLPVASEMAFYITLVFSLAMVLWKFIGDSRID